MTDQPPHLATPPLNPKAFYGTLNHKDVFIQLLSQLEPVRFEDVIQFKGSDLKQKHKIVAIIKHLLQTANAKNWNLCKRFEAIYVYNGEFWKHCSKDVVKCFLSDAAVKMGMHEYEAKFFEFADKLFKQFLSVSHLPEPSIDKEAVLINLLNETFEIKNNNSTPRSFNPNDFLCYQLPFAYTQNAPCQLFHHYLQRVLPDESCRMVLQEFIGFIFTKMNLEKCLVLLGSGGNGKSVFFQIINALLGTENVLNYSLDLFADDYNRAKLKDVLVNYSSEKGLHLHPDIFKALISGEPLQARELYGTPYTIHNHVKFIFNCNHLPSQTESTEAFFRRFLIIPFEETISEEEKDIHLAKKIIQAELPGVFNWALEGLHRLIEQQTFTKCEKSELALQRFRKQTDTVQLFIEERNYQPSEQIQESLSNLYQYYKTFCREDEYKPLGKVMFSNQLESKGFQKTRKNDGMWIAIEKNIP